MGVGVAFKQQGRAKQPNICPCGGAAACWPPHRPRGHPPRTHRIRGVCRALLWLQPCTPGTAPLAPSPDPLPLPRLPQLRVRAWPRVRHVRRPRILRPWRALQHLRGQGSARSGGSAPHSWALARRARRGGAPRGMTRAASGAGVGAPRRRSRRSRAAASGAAGRTAAGSQAPGGARRHRAGAFTACAAPRWGPPYLPALAPCPRTGVRARARIHEGAARVLQRRPVRRDGAAAEDAR
jgi:hypothetical protein